MAWARPARGRSRVDPQRPCCTSAAERAVTIATPVPTPRGTENRIRTCYPQIDDLVLYPMSYFRGTDLVSAARFQGECLLEGRDATRRCTGETCSTSSCSSWRRLIVDDSLRTTAHRR